MSLNPLLNPNGIAEASNGEHSRPGCEGRQENNIRMACESRPGARAHRERIADVDATDRLISSYGDLRDSRTDNARSGGAQRNGA